MKSHISTKFIIVYLVIGFISFFMIASLSSQLVLSYLKQNETRQMQKDASLIASQYMQTYFESTGENYSLTRQLDTIGACSSLSIWLMNPEREILLACGTSTDSAVPSSIPDFNPTASRGGYYEGNFYQSFRGNVLSVVSPVIDKYETKGYVILHKSMRIIEETHRQINNIIYLTFALVALLSFATFFAYNIIIHRPLQQIMKAVREYAAGNLSYDFTVESNDEMGILASSLNDMANRLSATEETQKNFISNVSHDFRSPLTSIKGYVEAIADGTIPPEDQQKYLGIISFEADRLSNLSSDLLTLNKLSDKNTRLNLSNWDINEVIKQTASAFEGACIERHIQIDLLFADRSTYVHADREKIQQVFYNLLDNAIKFSHSDSTVTVETTDRGSNLLISIKDRGLGIPKEDLPRIFDRFYKSDASRGKDKSGTGLGLAIVKEILKAHDEKVEVVSTEGAGTEFFFHLPLAEKS